MVWRIARKELVEMARDGRFRAAAGLVGALLLMALVTGIAQQRVRTEEVATAERLDRQVWDGQGPKNPHSAAHYGVYAFKPAPPLSFADRGLSAYLGETVWLEAHWQNLASHRPAEDRTALQRFGELTAATVLQLLLPLVIVLLAFSAFSGEREAGTLRQLASLGVPGRALALGKAFGVAGALGLILVPAAAFGALILVSASPGSWAATLGRAAVMAAGYLLYLAAFVGLALAVSAALPSSRVALVTLLGFWIGNGLVVPRLVADLSERLHPVPTATAMWAAMREDMTNGIDGHDPADARRRELESRTLAQYGVAKVEDLPVSFAGISLQAGEEYANQVFDRHYGALWGAYARQDRTHLAGALIAPLLAVRSLSMGLAGTDFAQHRHFVTAAEEYRRGLQRFLNGEMTRKARGLDFDYRADPAFWATAPRFQYEPPGLSSVLARQAPATSLLALWAAAASVAAVWAASRLRVA
jgi:ABC-2 type transport system permease protein